MPNTDKDKTFSNNHEIVIVKDAPQAPIFSAHVNESLELICNNDWDKVINRVKEKQHARLSNNHMSQANHQNLPSEIECQTWEGDMPLFKCLMFEDVPLDVVKCMTGNCLYFDVDIVSILNLHCVRFLSRFFAAQ